MPARQLLNPVGEVNRRQVFAALAGGALFFLYPASFYHISSNKLGQVLFSTSFGQNDEQDLIESQANTPLVSLIELGETSPDFQLELIRNFEEGRDEHGVSP